jgi:hypothetical protein
MKSGLPKMTFEFDFGRFTRSFHQGETINCTIKVNTEEQIKVKEVSCCVYCIRTVDPDGHRFSGFDASIPKPADRIIWQEQIPIKDPPSVIEDNYTFKFSFAVPQNSKMTESVRGKYVSVDYIVEYKIKPSGLFSSEIIGSKTFFIVGRKDEVIPPGEPVDLIVDKVDLRRSQGRRAKFKAHIHFTTQVATFTKPPNGYIEIIESDTPIHSITVSYVREEKLFIDRGNPRTLISEKNRTYVAENDPPYGMQIPFNIEWVRVHISPDIETPQFSISTGLKVRIVFQNDAYASATIPLKLYHDLAY